MAPKTFPLLQSLLLLPLVLSCPSKYQSKPSGHGKLFNYIQCLEGSLSLKGQNVSELYHELNFKEFIRTNSNHPGINGRKHTSNDEFDDLEYTIIASQSENYLKITTDVLGLLLIQNLLWIVMKSYIWLLHRCAVYLPAFLDPKLFHSFSVIEVSTE